MTERNHKLSINRKCIICSKRVSSKHKTVYTEVVNSTLRIRNSIVVILALIMQIWAPENQQEDAQKHSSGKGGKKKGKIIYLYVAQSRNVR